jgi:hypothetical protein
MTYKLHLPYFDEKWLKIILIDDKSLKNNLKTMPNDDKLLKRMVWDSEGLWGRSRTVRYGSVTMMDYG